jgi:hypothetical protein
MLVLWYLLQSGPSAIHEAISDISESHLVTSPEPRVSHIVEELNNLNA